MVKASMNMDFPHMEILLQCTCPTLLCVCTFDRVDLLVGCSIWVVRKGKYENTTNAFEQLV